MDTAARVNVRSPMGMGMGMASGNLSGASSAPAPGSPRHAFTFLMQNSLCRSVASTRLMIVSCNIPLNPGRPDASVATFARAIFKELVVCEWTNPFFLAGANG